jgi:hypothetical protein
MFAPTLALDDFEAESDIEGSIGGSDIANLADLESTDAKRRKILYVMGDVTNPNPDTRSRPQFVINCISDRGVWPRGGLTTAIIKHLTDAPKRAYEEAKRNDDLHLGDAHLVPVALEDDSQEEDCREIYVVNVIAQEYNPDTNSHGGIVLEALEKALTKVAYAAKNLNATCHLPRIGYGLPNVNWYGVERVIKKCLAGAGIKTLVYYFPRRGTNMSQKSAVSTWQPKFGGSPKKLDLVDKESDDEEKSPITNTLDDRLGEIEERDIFEDVKVCMYELNDDERAKVKRIIVANGGITCDKLESSVSVVVTSRDKFDDTLTQFAQNNTKIPIKCAQWVDACLKENDLVGVRLIGKELVRDDKNPRYEVNSKVV